MSRPGTWTPPRLRTSWTCSMSYMTPDARSCSSPTSTTSPTAPAASCGCVTAWSPTTPHMWLPLRGCGHDLVRHADDCPGCDARPPDSFGADRAGDPHRYRRGDLDRRTGHRRPAAGHCPGRGSGDQLVDHLPRQHHEHHGSAGRVRVGLDTDPRSEE